MDTTKLEAVGLTKRYGDVAALLPTDLQVRAGEFLTLLGPSGSGKTTLLMMISGLVAPSGGKLMIDGRDATHADPGRRGIGMVFQNYALFPHLTVWDNVAYGLRMRRTPRTELAAAVDEALAMVRMQDFGRRYPKELSGGQQQRIALARCFAYRPSVILLDEPLGALDKKLREHMQLEIRRLHGELGATFIYVTHDQDEALTMSDRICLMNQARIEQIGTPAELYDCPATRFAANFIGQSNLLDGRMEGPDAIRLGDRVVPVTHARRPALGLQDEASLLVRPETVELTPPADGLLAGTVSELVFLGSEVRAIVTLPSNKAFSVRCSRNDSPRLGEQVGLRWDLARASLLSH
ncbi:MAG: ABC transporter ATP-binding protein [Xenophilus sp.]